MKFGYARVSTTEQNLDLQLDALRQEGCDEITSEKVSTRQNNRPEWAMLLGKLRKGDEVVVYKLDRMARSAVELLRIVDKFREMGVGLKSLSEAWADTTTPAGKMVITIMAGFAELERDLIRQRTSDGLAAAKARGAKFGRPSKLTDRQKKLICQSRQDGASIGELASAFEVSNDTIYRVIKSQA